MTARMPPTVPGPSELERLIQFLETMRSEEAVYLDDLGWFRLFHEKAYDGKNPRTGERVFVPQKALLTFQADPNLIFALNGRAREELGDPTQIEPGVVIHRPEWARPIAKHVVQTLVSDGVVDILGFGTLRIEQREVEYDLDYVKGGTRVLENRPVWEMSESLRTRLSATVDR